MGNIIFLADNDENDNDNENNANASVQNFLALFFS